MKLKEIIYGVMTGLLLAIIIIGFINIIIDNDSKYKNIRSMEIERGITIGRDAVLEYLDHTNQLKNNIHIDIDTLMMIEDSLEIKYRN